MTCINLATSLRCSETTDSQITNSLNKFFNNVSGGLGGALSLADNLETAVSEISDSMSGLITSMSDLLQNKLISFIDTGLMAAKNFIFNKITNPIAALAQTNAFAAAATTPVSGLMGAFACLGSTIKKALGNTIKNMLLNTIKKGIVNPLECAVEDFIGGLTNKISNMMDSIVGPLINPINSLFSIIGKGFGSVKGFLSGGLSVLGKIQGLINCVDGGGGKCHEQDTYCLQKGSSPKKSNASKKNFMSKALNKGTKAFTKVGDKLDKLTEDIGDWAIIGGQATREDTECNTGNVLKCGLPRVEIFGGGGEGAVGQVILGNFIEELDNVVSETEFVVDGQTQNVGSIIEDVQVTGSIIGVDITYPGEGYTSEPLVSFVDNCDQGYGAYGRATIDKDPNSPTYGQLTNIIIISEGENYPTGKTEDVFVDRIEIEDGGSGYKLDDKIEDFEICGVDENGSITKVCTNDKAYRTLPSINIESDGSGAILTPVMTYRRRQSEIITVIDCITPRGNIVGYVNGKVYNGPFHVMPNGDKMTGAVHNDNDAIIYGTPQESLRSGAAPTSNVGSTKVGLRSIQQLVTESESTETTTSQTTENVDLYSDPVDEATNTSGGSTPPPSSPPSSGSSGGGYGY